MDQVSEHLKQELLREDVQKTLNFNTGPSSRGEITKNNKCGSIIKDDNFMITCADRSI